MASGKGQGYSEGLALINPELGLYNGQSSVLPVASTAQERFYLAQAAQSSQSSSSSVPQWALSDFGAGVLKLAGEGISLGAHVALAPYMLVQNAPNFAFSMLTNQHGNRDRFLADFQGGLKNTTDFAGVVASAVGSAASAGVAELTDFLNSPEKQKALLDSMGQAFNFAWKVASDPKTYANIWDAARKAGVEISSDPKKAALQVGKFVLESIGFFDACDFVRYSALAIAAHGSGNEAKRNEYLQKAAVHAWGAADFAGTVAVVVTTGGTGLLAKGAFKAAAKGLVTEGAEKIGKEVVQELTEKVTREVFDEATDKVVQQTFSQALEAGAREIADSGAKTLAKAVAQNGSKALTEESIKSAMRESGEKVTAEIMQSFGVEKLVKDKTLELLKTLSNASEADVIKILENQKIANPKAMAKKLQVALRDGTADKILQEELVDGISRELNESVAKGMEKTFKDRWTTILKGEGGDQTSEILNKAIRERAEKEGKEVGKLIDESVEAGWKGAREGAEKAVREAVEKGVRKAFEEFRKQRGDEDSSSSPGHKRSRTIGPGSVDTGVAFNNVVNFGVPVSSGSYVGAARSNEIGKFSSNLAATMSEASKTGGEAIAKAAELRKENPVEFGAENNIVKGPKSATSTAVSTPTTTTTTAATTPTPTTTA
jgi:hypothetical protein